MRRLAAALDRVRTLRGRLDKERALGEALAAIARTSGDATPLETAARIAAGLTLPIGDPRPLAAGWAILLEVAADVTGFPADVVAACARRTGDLGEALGLLVAREPAAEARAGVSLVEIAELFEALASSSARGAKRLRLASILRRCTPLEAKYLVKVLLGELRIGAQAGVLEGAIARAFDTELAEVRRAAALVTDPGELAHLAARHALADARPSILRPVAYMLATPIESIPRATEEGALDPTAYVVEDKLDGVRAQVHKRGARVEIFARGLERVSASFPEIVDAMRGADVDVLLDGELVAVDEAGRTRPFQALQGRLRRLDPSDAELAATRVAFVAYDVMIEGDEVLLDRPWTERRARLERWASLHGPSRAFVVNPCQRLEDVAVDDARGGDDANGSNGSNGSNGTSGSISTPMRIEVAFLAARARGNEGVVLKRVDAPYEPGRRGRAWIKVKRAFATLDVVITAAESGHGRRAGVLSDYTFAVWDGDELVDVGKAYSGLPDAEVAAVSERLERIAESRHEGARLVRPEIVLEVAFDGVQPSRRHPSGFALRFPRVMRVRTDKRPAEADRLETVEALFRAQLASGHREAPPAPRERASKRRRSAPPTEQLALFDDRALDRPTRAPR